MHYSVVHQVVDDCSSHSESSFNLQYILRTYELTGERERQKRYFKSYNINERVDVDVTNMGQSDYRSPTYITQKSL